jgi:hypothetical protein
MDDLSIKDHYYIIKLIILHNSFKGYIGSKEMSFAVFCSFSTDLWHGIV